MDNLIIFITIIISMFFGVLAEHIMITLGKKTSAIANKPQNDTKSNKSTKPGNKKLDTVYKKIPIFWYFIIVFLIPAIVAIIYIALNKKRSIAEGFSPIITALSISVSVSIAVYNSQIRQGNDRYKNMRNHRPYFKVTWTKKCLTINIFSPSGEHIILPNLDVYYSLNPDEDPSFKWKYCNSLTDGDKIFLPYSSNIEEPQIVIRCDTTEYEQIFFAYKKGVNPTYFSSEYQHFDERLCIPYAISTTKKEQKEALDFIKKNIKSSK